MTTTPRNEELPSIKSHDPLMTFSSGFEFSHTICRFRMQTPKSSPICRLAFIVGLPCFFFL